MYFFDNIKKAGHYPIDVDLDVNPALIKMLKSFGILVCRAEAFYRTQNCKPWIHSDAMPGDYVKINWVVGGKDSIMQWFTVNPNIHKEITTNKLNTTVCLFDQSEVTLAYEEMIQSPSLVQVGAPHNIINPLEDRICISLILADTNNKKITMANARKILASLID